MKPSTNFGKRCQISPAPTCLPATQSTLVHQYTATQKAVTPIMTFWIILMVAATYMAFWPRNAPAAATAPVESMVPPIQAPPRTSGMPTALMKAGMAILRPLLAATGAPKQGKMVIGTVKGDIHDIGKNLVGMMMEGAGFDVVWPQFLALAVIGAVLFAFSLARFRKTIAQMA